MCAEQKWWKFRKEWRRRNERISCVYKEVYSKRLKYIELLWLSNTKYFATIFTTEKTSESYNIVIIIVSMIFTSTDFLLFLCNSETRVPHTVSLQSLDYCTKSGFRFMYLVFHFPQILSFSRQFNRSTNFPFELVNLMVMMLFLCAYFRKISTHTHKHRPNEKMSGKYTDSRAHKSGANVWHVLPFTFAKATFFNKSAS